MRTLIRWAGDNPDREGLVGTPDRVAVALNKATPYLLTGAGVALCFRARIINIGAEGQIALGGLAATWLALRLPQRR